MNEDSKAFFTRVEEAVAAYPILTREVDSDLGTKPTGAALNGGSLNRVAQQTLRDLLGWRYRSNDVPGFTAALSKAFTPKHADGYVQWEWKPQSFSLQADLGAITGAQASIHAQARATVDHVLPLLDALKPLRADVDAEDSESIRSIIRSALQEIVNELAARSGPRVQRIDGYIHGLLGRSPAPDAARVGGYLGQLRDRFGLLSSRVNTVEEERNLTNFIVLVDQLISLAISWKSKRTFFTRARSPLFEPFLGTQLVQLAEVLDVIVEQVHETYAGMNSVFLGAAERQATTLRLPIGDATPPEEVAITVAELLSWVESFATTEGRELLQNGGKDGVVAFHDTLEPIAQLLLAAYRLSNAAKTDDTPYSFHSRRVSILLEALALHTNAAVQLASQIQGRNEMPCWIRSWLNGEHCDALYQFRRAPRPKKLKRNGTTYLDWEIGDDKISKAALHAVHAPEGQPPRHHTIEHKTADAGPRSSRIHFENINFNSDQIYDLVLLTESNRVLHFENAVELKQIFRAKQAPPDGK